MVELTREQLVERLSYDPDTGIFRWRRRAKNHSGRSLVAGVATRNRSKFYVTITIDGKKHKRARLAFLYMEGRWPEPCIDHINGNSTDDRWCNLREATVTQNAWNHKRRSRRLNLPMGVRLAGSGRYVARIAQHGRLFTIGTFDTIEQAASAYRQEREVRYGEFA